MVDNHHKVLIIDDEAALLLGLSVAMKRKGYQVITATNGQDGLALAKSELPDLIVSDVMMPPPNGFELRNLLSQIPSTADIPFIFLTARIGQEDKLTGIRSGADDYITKPFDREELLARVEAVLRRTEIERQRGRDEGEAFAQSKLEEFKQEISHNIHHELRTPLANIMVPLEAAVSKRFTTPQEMARFTEVALSNAARLQSLIEDMILLSDIDSGNLNTLRQEIRVEFDLEKVIENCLTRYQGKDLRISTYKRINGPIYAPRNEFKRVVHHLADNAFKFSPERGRVNVGIRAGGDGGCVIVFEDEGPGILPEEREKVFEKYYQVSRGDTRSYEGLGVGLWLSKTIAESLGGSLKIIDSTKGCTIRFSLPAGKNDFNFG
jgi:two-component system sensor histidine kinase/response regulator